MAENKRKKTDFSTGLKAAAEKLKPRDLRKDVLTISIGGVPTPIARGDMSDEAWANVIKQSVKEATPAEYKQPFPDRSDEPEVVDSVVEENSEPATSAGTGAAGEADQLHAQARKGPPVEDVKKSIDWPRLMSLGQNLDHIDKSLVSDDEKAHLKGMSEWSRAEFLRERMRKHGYEVPQTTAEAEKASLQKESVAEETAEPPGTQDEGGEQHQKQPSQQKPGTQTEDTVSSAGPGMSPLANAQAMMTGAAPKNIVTNSLSEVGSDALNKVAPMSGGFPGASSPAPATGGFPGLAGGDAGVNQANAKGAQNGAEDLATLRNFTDIINPMNAARSLDNALTGAMKPLNDSFTGRDVMTADQMDAQEALARKDPGVEYDPAVDGGVQPAAPGAPPQMPAQPPAPGGGSDALSASLMGGGGYTPAKVDPKAVALQQQGQEAATAAQLAAADRIEAESKNQKEITNKAAEIELHDRKAADVLGALATEAQLTAVKHAEGWNAARMSAAQAARDAAANPTDPNRYWNNKNDGQRAMATIAGMLYGFTGQGMQWLQRIDGLVDADNRLQVADRAAKVEGLNKYAAEMGAQADDAMKFGLSRAQAQLLARTQKLEGLKSQLDILTMRQTDSARAQQGAMMSAQLGQHIDGIASQGLQLAQQQAQMENANRYHNAQLSMQKMSLAVKAASKGAGGLGTKIPQAQQGIISAAEAGLGMLPELEKAIGNPKGELTTALKDQVAKMFPGTDANNRSISTAFLNRAIFAGIDKSVINAADQKFLDEIQSGVGISSLRKPGAIAALRRMLNESKKAAIRTAQQLDQNVGELSPTDTGGEDFGFEAVQ